MDLQGEKSLPTRRALLRMKSITLGKDLFQFCIFSRTVQMVLEKKLGLPLTLWGDLMLVSPGDIKEETFLQKLRLKPHTSRSS